MKIALTIAGSDSGAGAGIQADLKTFAALGVYGTSAITAVTAQNTMEVKSVVELPTWFIADEIDVIAKDFEIGAAKTGMLSSAEIIETVASKIKEYKITNLVVDPVMRSKSGHPLLKPEATQALIQKLLPQALVVTPNIPEAEVLLGRKIVSKSDFKDAARKIFDLGAKTVVVKGGHLDDDATDLFYDGSNFEELKAKKVKTKNTHGTGCTFSAAIAAYLVLGKSVLDAVTLAKKYITQALKTSTPLGHGFGPVNHFFAFKGIKVSSLKKTYETKR